MIALPESLLLAALEAERQAAASPCGAHPVGTAPSPDPDRSAGLAPASGLGLVIMLDQHRPQEAKP